MEGFFLGRVRIVDLSVPIESVPSEFFPPEVIHRDHKEGAKLMSSVFGCKEEDLPDGLGWADDTINKLSTHHGTHLDAPWHYAPTSEGKPAKTIDEIPLEWCYGDGVILDMRHKPQGSGITVEDLKEALEKINYKIKPGDIVMIMTGADKLWGKQEYLNAGCGMTREATLWLIEQGVRVVGIDAWGWDRPFWAIKADYEKTGDPSIIWEAHYVGREKTYLHIEKLANLDYLYDTLKKPYGFKVACFPVKVKGGSAGWCRAVAIIEE